MNEAQVENVFHVLRILNENDMWKANGRDELIDILDIHEQNSTRM